MVKAGENEHDKLERFSLKVSRFPLWICNTFDLCQRRGLKCQLITLTQLFRRAKDVQRHHGYRTAFCYFDPRSEGVVE